MKARFKAAALLLTLIRQQDPELFGKIQDFRRARVLSYECANCWNFAPLDQHGRCARCGSEAVTLVERKSA